MLWATFSSYGPVLELGSTVLNPGLSAGNGFCAGECEQDIILSFFLHPRIANTMMTVDSLFYFFLPPSPFIHRIYGELLFLLCNCPDSSRQARRGFKYGEFKQFCLHQRIANSMAVGSLFSFFSVAVSRFIVSSPRHWFVLGSGSYWPSSLHRLWSQPRTHIWVSSCVLKTCTRVLFL